MRRFVLAHWVVVALWPMTLGVIGCGAEVSQSSATSRPFPAEASKKFDGSPSADRQIVAGQGNDRVVTATPRRVIYSADVSMQTREFTQAEKSIPDRVKRLGGYLTDISLNRQQGEQRNGRWQARIPAEHFHEFLDGLDDIGVPERRQVSGQDITEEYVDLETRLANKKRLEERLLELMKAKSGSVADVIEFERQVASVREEIERMEGRFRFLINRSDLSSISISLREVYEYVPPQEPTFSTRLDETWISTRGTFRGWGEGILLGSLRSLPWLTAVASFGILGIACRRVTLRWLSAPKV